MIEFKAVAATLPASDYERAKAWYAEKLGLKPVNEDGGGAYYEIGSMGFLLYPSQFAGTNQATAAGFGVDDVPAAVTRLREAGVVFEEYDLPDLKTEDGLATMEVAGKTMYGAWFKDSEGNIIALEDATQNR